MSNLLMRNYHQTIAVASSSQSTTSIDIDELIVLLVSYLTLLTFTLCFIRKITSGLYQLPISPTDKQQKIIFAVVVGILGVVGIYSIFFGTWTGPTWVYYGLTNLLLAAFIYTYQTQKEHSLVISSILMILTDIVSIVLAEGINRDNPLSGILNLIGIVQGWATIWAVYVLNQYWFYTYPVSQKRQNIVFFIASILIAIVLTLGKLLLSKISIVNILGLIIVNIVLLGLMYMKQKQIYSIVQ